MKYFNVKMQPHEQNLLMWLHFYVKSVFAQQIQIFGGLLVKFNLIGFFKINLK